MINNKSCAEPWGWFGSEQCGIYLNLRGAEQQQDPLILATVKATRFICVEPVFRISPYYSWPAAGEEAVWLCFPFHNQGLLRFKWLIAQFSTAVGQLKLPSDGGYGVDPCSQLSALQATITSLPFALIPAALTQTASAAQATANRNDPADSKISNFTNDLCSMRKLLFLYLRGVAATEDKTLILFVFIKRWLSDKLRSLTWVAGTWFCLLQFFWSKLRSEDVEAAAGRSGIRSCEELVSFGSLTNLTQRRSRKISRQNRVWESDLNPIGLHSKCCQKLACLWACMLNINETSATIKCWAHVIICLKQRSKDFVLTVYTQQLSKLDTPHSLFVCPLSLHALPRCINIQNQKTQTALRHRATLVGGYSTFRLSEPLLCLSQPEPPAFYQPLPAPRHFQAFPSRLERQQWIIEKGCERKKETLSLRMDTTRIPADDRFNVKLFAYR